MIRLRVWANLQPMGWYGHAAGAYFFEYDPAWLSQADAYPLAPQFPTHAPLQAHTYRGDLVKVFFENLLPEGAALDDVTAAVALYKPSHFDLLGLLGKELPGVLSLLPADAVASAQQQYQTLEPAQLSQRIAQRSSTPLLLSNQLATMSLAGAQDKMGVRFAPKTGQISESIGSSPSTHILKPDTRQTRYEPSAINEYACMKLARALKLPVPDVWLLRVPEPVYVIERYDRHTVGGHIVCLHQIDGCQLLGHGSGWKYQRSAGLVSIPKIVAKLRALRLPGSDMLQLQRWVMFNFLIGNANAHAKNISLTVSHQGYRLAPFYDLLNVLVYGDNGMALFIGDEETFDAVGRHSWEALCDDCGFRLPEVLTLFRKMANALLPAWRKVRSQIEANNAPTAAETDLLNRMEQVFDKQVEAALMMAGG